MSFTKAQPDSFVTAVEARLAPLQEPQGKTAQDRRRIAEAFDVVMTTELGIAPVDVATEEHTIPVDGHPDARLRVYWPTPERPDPATAGGLPVFVYFFGGGFEIAGIDWVWWDAAFRERARDAGIIVVAGEYSHAPEVTYPAQPEQCWSIFEWAATHAADLGGDAAKLAIGGASAGGNLAAATALMNRDRANRPVRLQLLEMPLLDLTMKHLDLDGQAAIVPKPLFRRMAGMIVDQYVGSAKATRLEPYASPLLAKSLVGMPPAVIYTAELDALRGDGEAYARALSQAGVPVTCLRLIGQNHGSGSYRGHVPAADHLHRDIIATLRTLHDEPVDYAGTVAR